MLLPKGIRVVIEIDEWVEVPKKPPVFAKQPYFC
jgi:hypothetical protein